MAPNYSASNENRTRPLRLDKPPFPPGNLRGKRTKHPARLLKSMSQLKMIPTWTLELTPHDLRLVLQALGGRLKPESVEEAHRLGDRLTTDRVTATQREIDTLKGNLSGTALTVPRPPAPRDEAGPVAKTRTATTCLA